jgi:hypothetical protein
VSDSTDWIDTGQSFASELVKSYGMRYENGQWTWSVDNVVKEFKDHPFWTTVDYALLALPVAKWGVSAYKVSKGVGAAGRLYNAAKAGEAGASALASFGGATTRTGRFVERAGRAFGAQEGFGRAVELERRFGVAQTKTGQYLSSYVARRADDPEWQRLVDAAGGRDPNEWRAWGTMLKRDRAAEAAAWQTEAAHLQGRWKAAGVVPTTAAGKAAGDLVHRSLSLGHTKASAEVAKLVGKDVDDVYQASNAFRRKVHDGWFDAGFFPKEVYEAGLEGYMPRVHAQWERVKAAFPPLTKGGAAAGVSDEARGMAHGIQRKWTEADIKMLEKEGALTRILDPGVGMVEIGRAGMMLAGHNYARRLAESAVVRSADEVLESMSQLVRGQADDLLTRARRAQYTDEQLMAFAEWDQMYRAHDAINMGGRGTLEGVSDEVKGYMLRKLGWKPLEEVLGGADMPGHLAKVAEKFKGRWVDGAAVDDLRGAGKVMSMFEAMPQWMYKTVGTFKYTHTVLNAATQVRNKVGSFIFHHLTVGGMGIFNPKNPLMAKGARALHAGATGLGDEVAQQDWKDVLRSGFINTGHSAEITRDYQRAIGAKITPGKGVGEEMFFKFLDWMHIPRDSKIPTKIGDAMTWATKKYQYTDDLAKADAFLMRRDWHLKALQGEQKYMKARGVGGRVAGMTAEELREEAIGRAMVDVAKFQPMFSQVSPLANMVRDAIPFSSFTTEAARVWKNAIMERPLLTFLYNNMIEATSHVTGAMAGFDEKQLQDAEASLPWYMQGKKALTVPFRIDGKPVFVDFSYMIPMANLPETTAAEKSFFDMMQLNPFATNPVLGFGAAVATGIDPFTKREVEPTFTERQLGVTIDPATGGGHLRKAVGLAEYAARALLPPIAPPGSAGVNLLELAQGKRHGFTGQELEQGIARTLASNLLGLRSYQGDLNSQLLNAKREERQLDSRMTVWWDKWKDSAANGDVVGMDKAIREIAELRKLRGDDEKALSKYIASGIKQREPGKFRSLSTREIKETLARANRLGGLSDDDKAMRAELMARLQERTHRTRSSGRGRR